MANEAQRLIDLLHLPLEESASRPGRMIVLNAPAQYRLPSGFSGEAMIVQPFRPTFLVLEAARLTVSAQPQGDGFDTALVALGRHRGENERMLADAAARLRDGGLLVAAGFKSDGAASLRKRLAGGIANVEHEARYHGVVFWLAVGSRERAALDALAEPGRDRGPEGFSTAPGMFSHERVDDASRLLLEALPDDISGRVADLGAGWGYLSVGLVNGRPGIQRVDLYEASHAALEAAHENIAALAPNMTVGYFWHDVRREPIAERYDVVVMNPPFHESRAADPEIGRDFVRVAKAVLKPRGRLFLVANRGLPYEPELAGFAASGEVLRNDRFKVLWARR